MTASVHQKVPCTRKKMISLGSWLIAWCKLAPTLARQMWCHNYVIDRNEYLIFTLSESINPWVYSLQFLKSTNNSWRYERKCEWVFFSEHSVYVTLPHRTGQQACYSPKLRNTLGSICNPIYVDYKLFWKVFLLVSFFVCFISLSWISLWFLFSY